MSVVRPRPYHLRIDPANEILAEQVGWWASPQAGRRVENLRGPDLPTMNSGVSVANDLYGACFQGDGGANSYIDLGSTKRFLAGPLTPFTLMWQEKIITGFPAYAGIGCFFPGSATNPWIAIRTTDTANYGTFACGRRDGTTTSVAKFAGTPSMASSVGVWRTWILLGAGGMAGATAQYSLFVDSVSYSPTATVASLSTSTTAANTIGWDSADSKHLAYYDNFRLWGRQLQVMELARLFAFPWEGCLLQKSRIISLAGAFTPLPSTNNGRMFLTF